LEPEVLALLRRLPSGEGFAAEWAGVQHPETLLATAAELGVGGVILAAAGAADERLAERAARARAQGRVRHAWVSAALQEASTGLAQAGIPHLVLKGPPLAERLYEDPGARVSHDLDLLVAPDDLQTAISTLSSLRYLAEGGPHARYALQHHHHVHLARRGAPLLELHFRAFTGFGIQLEARPLLERAREGVLQLEDEVLYLALHAAGHLFERLGWLFDLKLLWEAHPELDLELLLARAAAVGAEAPLALTFARLSELGVPTEDLLVRGNLRLKLARALAARTNALPADTRRATLGRLAFQTLLGPDTPTAARFFSHHLGRIARRRLRQRWPEWTPQDWAG
jgi:hypothetical protein